MGALLDNVAFVHHQDQISVADGGQTVGDNERGATLHQVVHGLLNQHFGAGIDRAGCFIKDQNLGCDRIARAIVSSCF